MGNVFNRYGAGGGKAEGLYIWKKSEIKERSEMNSTSALKFDTTPPTENTITWYCGYSYTIENNEFVIDVDHRINNTNGVQTQFTETTPVYYMPRSNRGTKMVQTISTTATYVVGSSSTIGIYASAGVNNPINKFFIEKEFIGYVVSDKEDAYPDKEVKDGYYYERYSALEPALFGCTKYETGAVSVTSRVPTVTVSHSMGVKPKFAFVWKSRAQGTQNCRAVAITYSDDGIYCAMSNWGNSGSNTNGSVYNTASGVSTLSNVTLVSDASNNYYKFYSGGYSYILLG